jgi:hypothetical protein
MSTQLQPGSPEWLRREADELDRQLYVIHAAGLRAAAEQLEALAKTATDAVRLAHVYRESAEKAESELFTAQQTILRLEAERDRLREDKERLISDGSVLADFVRNWSEPPVGQWALKAWKAAIDAARKDAP